MYRKDSLLEMDIVHIPGKLYPTYVLSPTIPGLVLHVHLSFLLGLTTTEALMVDS